VILKALGNPGQFLLVARFCAGKLVAWLGITWMNSKPLSVLLEEAFIECRDMDASLAEKLQAFADAVSRLGPNFQEAVDRLIARLKEHDVGGNAPRPGEKMPPFVLPDEKGRLISLDKLLEDGPVAVTFHRGHWCPYCRINTHALAEAQVQIAAEGGQVAAIMPDREHFAAEFKAESAAPFPVLTDFDNGYALSLNLAFWVGQELQDLMSSAGWNVPRWQGTDTWLLPIPATFVVGTDGEVKTRFIDPDYRKRMTIGELLLALREAH
jgi:peroxiredoxin